MNFPQHVEPRPFQIRSNMLTPWTYEDHCGWLHYSSVMMMSWILAIVSCLVMVIGLPGWGSYSRLYLPCLISAAHFFSMLYEGTFSPGVITMSSWISLGVKPLRPRYWMSTWWLMLSILSETTYAQGLIISIRKTTKVTNFWVIIQHIELPSDSLKHVQLMYFCLRPQTYHHPSYLCKWK